MSPRPFSLILLPTLDCDAACDYCFEEKSRVSLAPSDLPRLTASVLDHMEAVGAERAEVYWQGGEAMLLGPAWYASANEIMGEAAEARGVSFKHYLQTNLIGYGPRWNAVIRGMFGGSVGTSMDFPNDHRRMKDGGAERYTRVWLKAVGEALDAGFDIGVIALLHSGSLRVSPQEFLDFFTGRAGVTDIQVNLPFPGGPSKGGSAPETAALARFLTGLLDAWAAGGLERGVRLGPFGALIDVYSGRYGRLPCVWQPSCADEFIAVGPLGDVAQCDCWVTSYPEHRFGNLFTTPDLSEMLGSSSARRAFMDRPAWLMDAEDCDACPHLATCHGGCPVRAFAVKGTLFAKDPYCEVYKAVFEKCRGIAAAARRMARASSTGADQPQGLSRP